MSHWTLLALSLILVSCSYNSPSSSNLSLADTPLVSKNVAANSASDEKSLLIQPASNVAQVGVAPPKPQVRAATAQRVSLKDTLGPARMCEGSVTHTERVLIPPVAKPPYGKYYKDPAFGSRVIRITNSPVGIVQKPPYSTMQAWNADESLLLLYRTGGRDTGHILLDGHTYKEVRQLDIQPSDLEEVYWSHTDPDTFYYVSKYSRDLGQFKKYSVSSGRAEVIADFSDICGDKGVPTGGQDVHPQSLDDDLWGFRCQISKSEYKMFSYRISTKELIVKRIGEGTPWTPWTAPSPAPSGDRFWYQGKALALDLETIEKEMDLYKSNEHSNVGSTYNGNDALFQTGFDPSPDGCDGDLWQGVGHLVEHDLQTARCRPMINEARGYPYTTSSTHISARAIHRPGWIAMSSIGAEDQYRFFSNKRKAPALFSEIYLANTDPDDLKTCRLAHHRSFGKKATKGNYPAYFGEPHATLSPSGTRIIFGSDWYDSGAVDSYIIELPGYQKPQ